MIEAIVTWFILSGLAVFIYKLCRDRKEKARIKELQTQEYIKGMQRLIDFSKGEFDSLGLPDMPPRVFKKQILIENSKRGVLYRSVKMDNEEFDTVMKHYLVSGSLHFNTIVDGQVLIGKKVLEELAVSIIDV